VNVYPHISDFLKCHQDRPQDLVFTNGCFDLLHVGHVRYLYRSRELGSFLVVGLNTDDSVRRLKGHSRPVTPQNERAEILEALSFVDAVVFFDEDTPLELISELKPGILTKGGDYRKENVIGADLVEQNGGKVVIIPFEPGYSTSDLLQRVSHRSV